MGVVLEFGQIDRSQVGIVGGKGANLGELARIEGVRVPDGFCVTTEAFDRALAGATAVRARIRDLADLSPEDRAGISAAGAAIRRDIEQLPVPEDVAAEILTAHARLGADAAYAVRSSATAEDLPTASFAGQQDTYLNVIGAARVLDHVRRCWASLFTERAVTYRLRNGFDSSMIRMAVVVQRMVFPRASGILMTADPVTSDRTVVSIDAGFGLGEALVSGLVNADVYKVRDGEIDKTIATKKIAVEPVVSGGTEVREIADDRRDEPVLSDTEVLRLAELGRRVEAHFGAAQDIEWCLDDEIRLVQSRPITTLFPVPDAADDADRVYVSVGHQQMMTDAMKPLGLSFWQLTSHAPMRDAGGRLFVDVTERLASPTAGPAVAEALGKSDPLMGDALRTVLDRGFVPLVPQTDPVAAPPTPAPIDTDPAIVEELIADSEASLAVLKREIAALSGSALLDFIHADIAELQRVLFSPRGLRIITAAMDATEWLNDRLGEWLGEKNPADALSQSVPGNVTSEMGLALLDVADAIRPHPQVVAYLREIEQNGTSDFLGGLEQCSGGPSARVAISEFLDRYGMRCVGEIDITRTRWSEDPTALVPTILGNVHNFGPGAGRERFEEGLRDAEQQRARILRELRALPDGENKAEETARMIDRVRTFAGYREYPKYGMVSRYFVYKQALLREAERLAAAGLLRRPEDIFFLRFEELRDVVRDRRVDDTLIDERREAFRTFRTLSAPRVLTSDGEAVTGAYRREDLPEGALPGMAVSAGTIEGRAQVVLDIGQADLEPGDILVTAYTDPSWTPLFVGIAGLITEVGGLMTHGAVIAREYGLPAVVGVEHATELIRDGQRIRVNGTDGYVEILT
ncbi:rifamycin-inactivating phosphotransferase [Nocardia caishijiensis]|uniref:Pyruvate,water dikinase n=1 Tax=Nocardia caishijiensis TaxID=184756 RepID=A0ABQ6YI13_9NOCA|nr:rifamycin-inactivating phosphotransferase [Nocardia caishijiensis]KAF0845423.1 pyruvate,water dikinase [Nocardia caishijiensis]